MRHALLAFLLATSLPLFGSTYVVNDLGDASDMLLGNNVCATGGGVCTLRAALEESNVHAGPDTITFSVAGTISPATELPAILQTLTIDATTAPGYVSAPVVILAGGGVLPTGLWTTLSATGTRILGLKIHGFTSVALEIAGDSSVISRNHLGPVGGGVANGNGLFLDGSSDGVTVGGTVDGDGNVISGNTFHGIAAGGTLHVIADNFIGVNAAGTSALANGIGILLQNTTSVLIGGSTAGTDNVISGNGTGISVSGGDATTIAGNLIGVNATGTSAISNSTGILVTAATNTAIGTTSARNVISGNTATGIYLVGPGAVVVNNIVGLNAAGTAKIPNTDGMNVQAGNTIGTPAAGNVVSGNSAIGIRAAGNVIIQNNVIGLDPAGTIALGNGGEGINVLGPNPMIGGTTAGTGNVISGNGNGGITCNGGFGLRVYGNTIGLAADRITPRPNLANGIRVILDALDVQIGSVGGGMNVISANTGSGIVATPSTSVVIEGNRIGTDGSGTVALGNELDGIVMNATSGAIRNNLISGNLANGISVGSNAIPIDANSIGANGLLGIDLSNNGVTLNDAQDVDTGANGLQNFPVIAGALANGAASLVQGSLNSTPNTTFTLQFFSSASPDPSGYGEGEQYHGATDVTTNASGDATFSWTGPPLTPGRYLTATTTGPTGTSEFSAAVAIALMPSIHFSASLYPTSESAGVLTVTVVRDGDLGVTSTIDYATTPGTALAGSDYLATSGTLTFGAGESTRTFTVTIINDAVGESLESFNVTLTNPSNAVLAAPTTAEVQIADDDANVPTASTIGLLLLLTALIGIAIVKLR